MTAPTSAAAVANYFLDLQESDPASVPPIDPMKLQKLLYYADAWWLAHKGQALFDEEIYAWPWGPVVPTIYSQFREHGRRPIIGTRATELVRVGSRAFDFRLRTPPKPEGEVAEFLRSVWDSHKHLSGVQLSNATHGPGEPWTIVKDQFGGDLTLKPQIPNKLIEEVFKEKLARAA